MWHFLPIFFRPKYSFNNGTIIKGKAINTILLYASIKTCFFNLFNTFIPSQALVFEYNFLFFNHTRFERYLYLNGPEFLVSVGCKGSVWQTPGSDIAARAHCRKDSVLYPLSAIYPEV